TPPPPEVRDHAEDRAITVPGSCRVATLLPPASVEDRQPEQFASLQVRDRLSGRIRCVGLFGRLLKELERLPVPPRPLPQLRNRNRPRELRIARLCARPPLIKRNAFLLRAPQIREGIMLIGNGKRPELRDIERLADIRQPVQTRQPPNGENTS